MRRNRRRTVILLSTVILALASAEFSARVWLTTPHPQTFNSHHLSSDFEAESYRVNVSNHLTNDGYWISDDITGAYFTIKNGVRVTQGQPVTASHEVWMFGNSELFGLFSAQGQTIPDYLQQMTHYKVVNLGSIGADVTLQTVRLKRTAIRPGDIVIYLDGNVDIAEIYAKSARAYSFACSDKFAMTRVACQWLDLHIAPTVNAADLARGVTSYQRAIVTARLYAEQRGATFYHFFAPSFANAAPDNLADITQDADQFGAGRTAINTQLYPIFRDADPRAFSLQHLLDGLTAWADVAHTNAAGNAAVARAIYAAIWRTF